MTLRITNRIALKHNNYIRLKLCTSRQWKICRNLCSVPLLVQSSENRICFCFLLVFVCHERERKDIARSNDQSNVIHFFRFCCFTVQISNVYVWKQHRKQNLFMFPCFFFYHSILSRFSHNFRFFLVDWNMFYDPIDSMNMINKYWSYFIVYFDVECTTALNEAFCMDHMYHMVHFIFINIIENSRWKRRISEKSISNRIALKLIQTVGEKRCSVINVRYRWLIHQISIDRIFNTWFKLSIWSNKFDRLHSIQFSITVIHQFIQSAYYGRFLCFKSI